jgi:hypothetical protein
MPISVQAETKKDKLDRIEKKLDYIISVISWYLEKWSTQGETLKDLCEKDMYSVASGTITYSSEEIKGWRIK